MSASKSRTATRDLVTIGQRWELKPRARRVQVVLTIRQVRRADKMVEATVRIPFGLLREKFNLVDKQGNRN